MRKYYLPVMSSIFILIFILNFTQSTYGKSRYSAYKDMCKAVKSASDDSLSFHYVVFINLHACLTCSENLELWHELEDSLPKCGGSFSFWASQEDSLDVAEAMRLECFSSSVRIIDQESFDALKFHDIASPLKFLFDKDGDPITASSPASENRDMFEKEVLEIVCEGK